MTSVGEETLALQLRAEKINGYQREYEFAKPRKWRADFAWPHKNLLVEIEGAVYSHGRHTRGSGFVKDMEKYNAAAVLGWKVLRFTTQQVKSGAAIAAIRAVLGERVMA